MTSKTKKKKQNNTREDVYDVSLIRLCCYLVVEVKIKHTHTHTRVLCIFSERTNAMNLWACVHGGSLLPTPSEYALFVSVRRSTIIFQWSIIVFWLHFVFSARQDDDHTTSHCYRTFLLVDKLSTETVRSNNNYCL